MKGDCILVSGVSRGLGLAITRVLLDAGYRVFGLSRNLTDDLSALQEMYPGCFEFFSVDLSVSDSLEEKVFRDFLSKETILRGLVNNAAFAYDDLATNLDLAELEQMYRINVFAPMILTRGCIKNFLLHNTNGSLVHLSSVSTRTGYKGLSFYASTKGALEAYSKNVAREWGQRGIRSNCVAAGFMETAMTGSLDAGTREKIYRRSALNGPTDPQQVSQTVEYLLSTRSASITGEVIRADNGSV
ncbi:MAG: SDR family oxidoreductase [Verrucomicrobiota bacterium]